MTGTGFLPFNGWKVRVDGPRSCGRDGKPLFSGDLADHLFIQDRTELEISDITKCLKKSRSQTLQFTVMDDLY